MGSRKIAFLDASVTCLVASAMSEMAAELQRDEQASLKMLGELSYLLSEMRKEVCKWEKKLQRVPMDNTLLLATTYQSRCCCQEREPCGFLHGDDFIVTGDSLLLAQMNLDCANVM